MKYKVLKMLFKYEDLFTFYSELPLNVRSNLKNREELKGIADADDEIHRPAERKRFMFALQI